MKKDIFKNRSKHPADWPDNRRDSQGMPEHERRLADLCAAPIPEVLEVLGTTTQGLSAEEAEHRLDEYGPNEMAHARKRGFLGDMFERIKSPLVIQLMVIAVVSGVIGEIKSTVIVSVMVLLSIGLGLYPRQPVKPGRRDPGEEGSAADPSHAGRQGDGDQGLRDRTGRYRLPPRRIDHSRRPSPHLRQRLLCEPVLPFGRINGGGKGCRWRRVRQPGSLGYP